MKLYKIQNTRIIVIDELFATYKVFKDFEELYKIIDQDPCVSRVHVFISMIADKEIYDIVRSNINIQHNHRVTVHSRRLSQDRKRHYINDENIKNKFRVDGSRWVTFSLGNGYNLCFIFDNFGFISVSKYKGGF